MDISIPRAIEDYYNQIPQNTGSAIFISAAFSFTVTIIVTGALPVAAAAAAGAGLASLIDGLVNPIFEHYLGQSGHYGLLAELSKRVVVIVLTGNIAAAAGFDPFKQINFIWGYIFLTAIAEQYNHNSASYSDRCSAYVF